jgi:16S rRNA (cytidine1402-2'-O)-methyltransferase
MTFALLPGTLYIVATPIGNMADFTERAKKVLAEVDIVLAEDTRVAKHLLDAIVSSAKLHTVHQHTDDMALGRIVEEIRSGKTAAFVSDAGTPNISDPGGKLVQVCVEAGVSVVPIPGVSALATALSICGFPSDRMTFLGFPPQKNGRKTYFEELAVIEHTIVLYEAKFRIEKTLGELPQDRLMMLGRELTKMHETVYRGTAKEILAALAKGSGKGEFVIVLAPKQWK